MEKRLLLAVVLMVAVVFIVNLLFPPAAPRREPPVSPDTTAERAERAPPPPETADRALDRADDRDEDTLPRPPDEFAFPGAEPAPPAARQEAAPEDTVWVDGPLYRLGFVTRGARLVFAELPAFESLAPDRRGQPAQLVPPDGPGFLSHAWVVGDDTLDLTAATFQVEPRDGIRLQPDDTARTLTFTYRHPNAQFTFEVRYTFRPDRYLAHMEGRLAGVPGTGWWVLGMGSGLLSNEWDPQEDYQNNLAYAARGPDGVKSRKVSDVDPGRVVALDGPFHWVAVRSKYFVTAVVLPQDVRDEGRFAGLRMEGLSEPYRVRAATSFPVGRDGAFAYNLYVGPQDYGRLQAAGHDLDEVTPYGYAFLQPIIRPLVGAITDLLVWSHEALRINYGWILILFGIAIRVILFPLYQKSMRSQLATMRVQPLMKEIQTRYKGDPQKMQQEMMKLYREHKINPVGGCLPMLLPFPILIALFFVFRDTIEFRGVEFLWLPDLSQADPYYIIPVLMGLSVFLLQWIGQRGMPPNPQMKIMMWVMPIFLTVLFLNFAAGLNLYYATMNLASIPQQLYLAKERRAAADAPPLKAKA